MDNNLDNLKKLIDRIKTIGFWERLFSWKNISQLLVDAVSDLQKIVTNLDMLREQNASHVTANSDLTKDLKLAHENLIRKDGEIERLTFNLQDSNSRLTQNAKDISAMDTTIKNYEVRINQLVGDNRVLTESNSHLTDDNKKLSKENATNTESITNLSNRKNELEVEVASIKERSANLQKELDKAKEQNTQLLSEEENRKLKYENETATLTSIREQIQDERSKEVEDRTNLEIDRLKNLKETWTKHQGNAKSVIKNICNKHTIEYIEKVPFKGEPDNTLKICDEFVIFDAKSPATDDLSNFPNYLKDQAERAKKYAKQDDVKSDIFFVVPTNTLEKLTQFVYNLADYNVYIISVDSLEQIILGLKKIEEYEFAEQLSPEERDNICRVLGKFAHLTKRRIQIDSFFAKQFIELAYKSETDLPKDIMDKVVEFEKSEKLNPPIEKRAKAISIKELEKDSTKLNNEASSKGISIDDSKISLGINALQLYKTEEDEQELV